jgi:hypothetical protein
LDVEKGGEEESRQGDELERISSRKKKKGKDSEVHAVG